MDNLILPRSPLCYVVMLYYELSQLHGIPAEWMCRIISSGICNVEVTAYQV